MLNTIRVIGDRNNAYIKINEFVYLEMFPKDGEMVEEILRCTNYTRKVIGNMWFLWEMNICWKK